MLNGGGTVLLSTSGEFTAPGGQTVLIDPTKGDLITFHALANSQNGLDYLFVNQLTWPNDWPLIGRSRRWRVEEMRRPSPVMLAAAFFIDGLVEAKRNRRGGGGCGSFAQAFCSASSDEFVSLS